MTMKRFICFMNEELIKNNYCSLSSFLPSVAVSVFYPYLYVGIVHCRLIGDVVANTGRVTNTKE